MPVHEQRRGRAAVPLRSTRRQHRYQRRRGSADGLLPLLRLEGELLRRPARPGARCDRLLYGKENRRRTLAGRLEPEILMWQRAAIAAVTVAAAVALSIPAIRYVREEPPSLPAAIRLSLAPPDGAEL